MRVHSAKAILLIAPSLMGVGIFYLLPILYGIPFSIWSPARGFLGLDTFAATLSNPMFIMGIRNSILFLITSVPLTLLGSLSLSLWIHAVPNVGKWMQSVLFLPFVLPTVCALFAFRWLLDYNGIVNRVLTMLGGERVAFFSGGALRSTILLLFLWKNIGYFVAFLSARLASTPRDLLETAQLDGANYTMRLFSVYLPHLAPTLVFAVILCTVQALDIFRECYLLAGNYPSPEAYTLQHYLYNRFHNGDYASAAAALYLILPLLVFMVWGVLKGEKHAQ